MIGYKQFFDLEFEKRIQHCKDCIDLGLPLTKPETYWYTRHLNDKMR